MTSPAPPKAFTEQDVEKANALVQQASIQASLQWQSGPWVVHEDDDRFADVSKACVWDLVHPGFLDRLRRRMRSDDDDESALMLLQENTPPGGAAPPVDSIALDQAEHRLMMGDEWLTARAAVVWDTVCNTFKRWGTNQYVYFLLACVYRCTGMLYVQPKRLPSRLESVVIDAAGPREDEKSADTGDASRVYLICCHDQEEAGMLHDLNLQGPGLDKWAEFWDKRGTKKTTSPSKKKGASKKSRRGKSSAAAGHALEVPKGPPTSLCNAAHKRYADYIERKTLPPGPCVLSIPSEWFNTVRALYGATHLRFLLNHVAQSWLVGQAPIALQIGSLPQQVAWVMATTRFPPTYFNELVTRNMGSLATLLQVLHYREVEANIEFGIAREPAESRIPLHAAVMERMRDIRATYETWSNAVKSVDSNKKQQ